MNLLIQYSKYMARRYGRLNLCSLGLITITTIIFSFSIVERHRLTDINKQSFAIKDQLLQRKVDHESRSPDAVVSVFYDLLPKESDLTNQIEDFFDVAFDNDIYLDGVEYKFDDHVAAKFSRCRITLPVSGTYTNLRKFVKQVLEKMPNAALTQIALSRENPQETDINARLQFIVLLRSER